MSADASAAATSTTEAVSSERGVRILGPGLVLVVSVCALWLGATGQLAIYVNPGNTGFIMTMAAIAVVACVAALAVRPTSHVHAHDEDHDHEPAASTSALTGEPRPMPRPARRRLAGLAGVVTYALCAAFALAFLVLPPRALSASIAEIRDVNGGLVLSEPVDATVELAADADYSTYGLREWAALLRQSTHPEGLIATPFSSVGFVTPSEESDDSFVLTRFVVSHCAIDAQPVGVTVYSPGWSDRFEVGDWVTVDGAFATAPDASASMPVSVAPRSVEPTAEPDVPYEY